MRYLLGIDGGGTRTTLALADESGREILRRTGPAGLVDPRRPAASAEVLAGMAREAFAEAGLCGPAAALCAGLAGVEGAQEREVVEGALLVSGIAERVVIRSDGVTALHGAFDGAPGILVVAGTGSVAWGRAEDGRVERCGGWGLVVGDEGSGYAIGRAAVRAALRAADGRGAATRLLPALLKAMDLSSHTGMPSWVGRAAKAEVAALAVLALRLAAEGDEVASAVAQKAADDLAEHAFTLARRLGPWGEAVPVVLHGGVTREPGFAARVRASLAGQGEFRLCEAVADAVAGAVLLARAAARAES